MVSKTAVAAAGAARLADAEELMAGATVTLAE